MERASLNELVTFLNFVVDYRIAEMTGILICHNCCTCLNSLFRFESLYLDNYDDWCEKCTTILNEVQGYDVVG